MTPSGSPGLRGRTLRRFLALTAEGRRREAAPYLATSLRRWPLQRRAWLLFLQCDTYVDEHGER